MEDKDYETSEEQKPDGRSSPMVPQEIRDSYEGHVPQEIKESYRKC